MQDNSLPNSHAPFLLLLPYLTAGYFLFLLLMCIYGKWLIDIAPSYTQPLAFFFVILLGPFFLVMDFMNPVYTSTVWFYTLICAGIVVALGLIQAAQHRKTIQTILLVILGLLVMPPWAVPQMYEPFLLTAKPKQGIEMVWLTEPKDRFAKAFKNAQRLHEAKGCQYTLQGWNSKNQLYYGSNCRNDIWQYDPKTDATPQRIRALPSDFESSTAVTKWEGSVRPSAPAGIRGFTITFEKSTSPSGLMEAAVIQEAFYGPLDVVVLHR